MIHEVFSRCYSNRFVSVTNIVLENVITDSSELRLFYFFKRTQLRDKCVPAIKCFNFKTFCDDHVCFYLFVSCCRLNVISLSNIPSKRPLYLTGSLSNL